MISKLYVGNLAYSVTDDSLRQAFAEFGDVSSAKVMMDRDTGRSKGFGFVEMGSVEAAQAAIRGMHGKSVDGRALVVNEARPREERPGGFGYVKRPNQSEKPNGKAERDTRLWGLGSRRVFCGAGKGKRGATELRRLRPAGLLTTPRPSSASSRAPENNSP